MERSDNKAWIPIVFGLPFIAVGAFFTLTGFEVYPLPGPRANAPLWVLGCVGAAFLAAGLLVTGAGVVGALAKLRGEDLNRLYPNEPWLSDYDWDREGIRSAGFAGVVGGAFGLVFLCTFLAPFHWWAWMSNEGGMMIRVIVGIFELFAALFALAVLRGLAQWLKYGRSRLRFRQFPFHPGESLEVVFSPNRFDRLRVALRYRKRYAESSGNGDNATTRITTETLYEETRDMECSALDAEVTIAFRLPDDDRWVNSIATQPSYYWELEIRADVPGVDFEESFKLPVYASRRTRRGHAAPRRQRSPGTA